MDDTSATVGTSSAKGGKPKRGKDQLPWSDEVWESVDQAVHDEIMRSRMASKFLPQVYVHKKKVNVDSDAVVLPTSPTDQALSVDETQTTRIQEYWIQFKLSPAQMEAEGSYDAELTNPVASATAQPSAGNGHDAASNGHDKAASRHGAMSRPHRASTCVSLAQYSATILAQAEDAVIFSGLNALQHHPLFASGLVTYLDPTLPGSLDAGLLNITSDGQQTPKNTINLPSNQVVLVHPAAIGPVGTVPMYRENSLNALAQAVSILQSLGHYEGYSATFNTVPYADLFQALPTTLIEPVMPASSLMKSGIFGTGVLPPFVPLTLGSPGTAPTAILPQGATPSTITVGSTKITLQPQTGLPSVTPVSGGTNYVTTQGSAQLPLPFAPALFPEGGPAGPAAGATVLYTGVVVGLTGNTMDLVRGQMDDGLDVSVTFNQKDQNEQYRFRAVQRLALRLKDPTAVVLLLFLDC